MDSLSLCWRGMAGVGKRAKLHEALAALAAVRGLPFTIQMRSLMADTALGNVTEAGATEEGAGPDDAESGQFQYEYSLVHIGLDIARMSMQDKHILRPVLTKLGQGSQVMAGEQGRGSRILVLYHTHLLSSESVLLVQACLEQNEGDLSIWMTSELPVPQRIRDWFIEIPVAGTDHSFEAYVRGTATAVAAPAAPLANWPSVFRSLLDKWRAAPAPVLHDVKEVKAVVYDMLMRNLRWVEVVHFLLDVILEHPDLSAQEREAAVGALAACEATAGGYTIPSYRIPILWESLFLQLRSICAEAAAAPRSSSSKAEANEGGAPSGSARTSRTRRRAAAAATVGAV
jgi:hypothetical protein